MAQERCAGEKIYRSGMALRRVMRLAEIKGMYGLGRRWSSSRRMEKCWKQHGHGALDDDCNQLDVKFTRLPMLSIP